MTERSTEVGELQTHAEQEETNYLNVAHTVKSWLLTGDHKRIAILYLFSVSFFFMIGSFFAALIRLELISPSGVLLESETYNKVFSAHGIVMIFLFLVAAIPAVFGNFFIPIMIGARDLAFPRMNLASWYVFMTGGVLVMTGLLTGGVDTGWTFYTPYSSLYSNTQVSVVVFGVFFAGFASIMTGLNFIGFATPSNNPPNFQSFLAPATAISGVVQIYRYLGGELSTQPANPALVQRIRSFAAVRGLTPREVNVSWLLNQPFPAVGVISTPRPLTDRLVEYERASQLLLNNTDRQNLGGTT